jgi:hypothetical protein
LCLLSKCTMIWVMIPVPFFFTFCFVFCFHFSARVSCFTLIFIWIFQEHKMPKTDQRIKLICRSCKSNPIYNICLCHWYLQQVLPDTKVSTTVLNNIFSKWITKMHWTISNEKLQRLPAINIRVGHSYSLWFVIKSYKPPTNTSSNEEEWLRLYSCFNARAGKN